jgi:hypothetical protein
MKAACFQVAPSFVQNHPHKLHLHQFLRIQLYKADVQLTLLSQFYPNISLVQGYYTNIFFEKTFWRIWFWKNFLISRIVQFLRVPLE